MEQKTRRWARIARLSLVAVGGLMVVLATCGLASIYTPNVPCFSALPISGPAPQVVRFSAAQAMVYEWDFTNDGTVDATEQNPTHTYNVVGWHTVRLVLTLNVQGTMYRLTQTRVNYIWVMPTGSGTGGSQSQSWPWPWPWPSGQQNQPSQQQNPSAQSGVSLTIYWGNLGDDTIRRASSTGGMYGTSIPMAEGAPYVDKPTGIQFYEGWVVWANYGNDTIYAKEVGSGVLPTRIADKDAGVNKPSGLCAVNDLLYWANQGDGMIHVMTMKGAQAEKSKVVTIGVGASPPSLHAETPYGVQVAGNYLYWTNAGDNTIRRAHILTYSSVENIETVAGPVVSGVDQPGALRVVNGYLYWANGGDNTIRRCSLNGPFPAKSEKLAGPEVSKVNVPTGIAVLGNMIGWANYSNNTFHACTIGSSPCQSTLMGTNQSSQIDGPSFIWVEASS